VLARAERIEHPQDHGPAADGCERLATYPGGAGHGVVGRTLTGEDEGRQGRVGGRAFGGH